jgi:hypothetical protein
MNDRRTHCLCGWRAVADLLKAEQVEPDEPRTAVELIQEATRYVNWMPNEKHTQQARYDALSALMHIYAYSAAVALGTLQRIDPEAAERVARHIGRDDWDAYVENAWIWNEALSKGDPIDPDDYVFTKLTGVAHDHQPRCCCDVPPGDMPAEDADPTYLCPGCPEHGELTAAYTSPGDS